MGLIGAGELDSLAHSPFAKEKADNIIEAAAENVGYWGEDYSLELEREHEMVDYRLVPRRVLEAASETIKTLSENYNKLMQETAPLILEAAKTPGNKWNSAMRVLGEAAGWDANNLPSPVCMIPACGCNGDAHA